MKTLAFSVMILRRIDQAYIDRGIEDDKKRVTYARNRGEHLVEFNNTIKTSC